MKTFVRLPVVLALVVASFSAGASTAVITVGDNFYSPQLATIHPGDVVTWQYQGGTNFHPTASDTGAWTTFTINSANTANSLTFNTAGSFPYHCNFHGGPGVGMYGVVTVATALAADPAQLAAAALRAYPNPAGEAVALVLGHEQAREHNSVQVFNVLGSLVRTVEVRPEWVDHEVVVGVGDLPRGLYFYRLLVNGRVVAVQRLVLAR